MSMRKMKIYLMGILMASCLALSGCNKTDSKEENTISEENTDDIINKGIVEESENQEEKSEEEIEETGNIYYIDYESGEMKTEEVELEVIDEYTMWESLQEKGIVPENTNVLSFVQDGEILQLDLDTHFGDYFRKQGTTGEVEILKCIVNSYLDTFHAQKIKITETGLELASSHKIYDDYLTKME